ncbi:His/Gly/Thr/Pro-type tRNA ligase C-terminal domain-containing protein [Nocardia fluminea]|uniref:His/Gly/Thr/Pro-type tRNA ligase C-terminal domain-containing protein n=1 Tax=Nocardia fluminea TaxID=134984 RepID=UPI00364BA3D0
MAAVRSRCRNVADIVHVAVVAAPDELAGKLGSARVRVYVDDRDQTPGWKFNEWEKRGVPVRVELGPRDLAAGTAVMVRRLGEGKQTVDLATLPDLMSGLDDFQGYLLARATAFREENTGAVDDWAAFEAAVAAGWATSRPSRRRRRGACRWPEALKRPVRSL